MVITVWSPRKFYGHKSDILFQQEILLAILWLIWKALPKMWNELSAIFNFNDLKTFANNAKIKSSLKFLLIRYTSIMRMCLLTAHIFWISNLLYNRVNIYHIVNQGASCNYMWFLCHLGTALHENGSFTEILSIITLLSLLMNILHRNCTL
jgi:hypothetical protein